MTPAIPCTVQLLCRNNAASIGACLDSLGEFAEVIVQDGSSTDGTREIALVHPNVRIIDQNRAYIDASSRITDFASMRNESIAAARHDWLFVVDADEAVTPAQTDEVRSIVQRGIPGVFVASRRFVVDGKVIDRCSGYPAEQIRLFHRSLTHGYVKTVHERLHLKNGVTTQHLQEELLVPLPPASSLPAKHARYLDMEVRRLGVVGMGRWTRWILLRNLRTAAGLLLRIAWIRLTPTRATIMPLRYELPYVAHVLRTIVRTFPPFVAANIRRYGDDAGTKR
ncbi:MAG: family 2 glycosyl transferase [Candidatus Peregrinibacteria bacterium Gr01-1014_25]|nr:MAG: family 2 glycosyl transferase [Candidatus Peregrinibacteria bacterium Gr01-1014_25]